MRLDSYKTEDFYDEMFEPDGRPRPRTARLADRLLSLSDGELERRQTAADLTLLNMGITFSVYGHSAGTEKVWPFDIIPRIVELEEWNRIERGLKQRITALNLFIDDVYDKARILKDRVVPEELLHSAKCFLDPCAGLKPPRGVWCHITGTDLVRDTDGQYYVLEDNLRCPSGVSYVLQNRQLMKQTFPQLFERSAIRPVDDYCSRLLDALQYLMGDQTRSPSVALLSPGMHNSAYFEHSFLAQQMGIDLVEGRDLVVSE